MAYRSQAREKRLNIDSGKDALGSIMQFLEMGIQNTKNEADQWVSGLDSTITAIDSAGTSEQFQELETLIDNYMEQGEEYSDMLGSELYNAKAAEFKNKLSAKQGILSRFENTMNTVANTAFDPKYAFNLDDFYNEDGTLKEKDEFVAALQDFDNRRGGIDAPIYWGEFAPTKGSKFLNFWANLSENAPSGLAERYAPMTVLSQGMDSVLNSQQYLNEMGITFDAAKGLVDIPDNTDLKREYEISYM